MNQTKINEIAIFCDSLTKDEIIVLAKKLIVENEELKSENEELKAKLWLLAFHNYD